MKPSIPLKKSLLFFFLIIISLKTFGQDAPKELDSILHAISNATSDSLKASSYYKTSFLVLKNSNNVTLSFKYADSAMYYSKTSNHKDLEAKSHFLYGLLNRLEGNYDEAIQHLEKNIAYFKNNPKNKAYALYQVGVIYSSKGQYNNSLKTYLKILTLFEKTKDSFAIASTLNSIANIYNVTKKYDKAIDNYNKATIIFTKLNAKRDIAIAHKNIGITLLSKKDTITARKNILKALSSYREIGDSISIGETLRSLGSTFSNSNPKKTLYYYNEAKKILEKQGSKRGLTDLYQALGYHYKNTGNYSRAILYYDKSLVLAKELVFLSQQKDIYDNLSQIYEWKKDFKNAYTNQSQYISIKDSLFTEKNIKEINQLQTQFETEKKDKEIIQQKLLLEQNEVTLLKKKTQYYWALGTTLFLLLVSLSGWIFYKQRQKLKNKEIETLKTNNKLAQLEALIKGEEKERKRLAQDLHDGINGDLSVIKYKITSIENKKLNTTEKEDFNLAISMLDNAIEQVRHISHNLAPPSLQNFNIIEAIQQYCSKITDSSSIKIDFQNYGSFHILSKEIETAIYRIVQEAINNIVKHSKATEALVQINNHNNTIHLTIEDNGIGFKTTDKYLGLGLKNIHSRVAFLRGEVTIESNSEGTSIQITIDLKKLSYD